MTDHVFEAIGRYVTAVPPASTAAREAARLGWKKAAAPSDVTRPEVAASAAVSLARLGARLHGRRGTGRRRRLYGARQRPLRLTTIAVAACLIAVTLVVGIAVERHLGSPSVHPSPAAAAPASCSKGPYRLTVTDPASGHGAYPLVAPYQFVVLRPVTESGVPVSGLVAGRLAAVFLWQDGAWKTEAPLPVPAPNSEEPRGRAIIQFTSRYPEAKRYLLQVPFDRTGATAPSAQQHSLLLCTTVVISPQAPGVTTTEGS